MNANFLFVTDIQVKNDKNGNQYKVVSFSEVSNVTVFGKETTVFTGLQGKRVMRPATTLPDGNVIAADKFYDTVKKGEPVMGSIMKFNTTDYEINGRTVNQYSCVVFNGENAVSVANRNLKSNNACVVDEYGQPTSNNFGASYSQSVKIMEASEATVAELHAELSATAKPEADFPF